MSIVERWFEDLFTRADQRVLEMGILIFRVEGAMVKEFWSEMSDLQVVMQLGVFPAPGREGTR